MVTIGLDRVTPVGIDESRSWIWMDNCWEARGIIGPSLTTQAWTTCALPSYFLDDWEDFPNQSSWINSFFCLQQKEKVGTESLVRSLRPLILFLCFPSWLQSLWRKVLRVWLKIIIKRNFLHKNSHLQVVSLWAKDSGDGLGPSPQVARRWRVTKEWKLLSANRQAL